MHGGPPDKWTKFAVEGSSDDLLAALNLVAKVAPPTVCSPVCHLSDGDYIFVGSYTNNED